MNWEDFEIRAHFMPCRKSLNFGKLFKYIEMVPKDEVINVKAKVSFLNKYLVELHE